MIGKKYFFGFKIYYLIYLLIAFNAFVNETKWLNYGTLLLVALGVGCAGLMLVKYKEYLKIWNIRLLILFLVSYALSSAINIKYGVGDNVKEMIWIFLSMIVLYTSGYLLTMEERKKELKVYAIIWTIYCTIINVLGISMILWGRNYQVSIYQGDKVVDYKVIGFKWGRLWGLYDDPNHGATISVVAILLAVYLFVVTVKWYWKVLLAITMLIQFGYIVLSDSRTGLVTIGVGAIVWSTAMIGRRLKKRGKTQITAMAIGFLIGIVIAGGIVGAATVCKYEYNAMDKQIAVLAKKMFSPKNRNLKSKAKLKVGRKKDLKKDASNGRIEIWESGLEIAKTAPIAGVSFRNMTAYAEKNMPKTYLVNNSQYAKYDSMHNAGMDLLVSQGIIGVLIAIAMVINTCRLLTDYWKRAHEEKDTVFLTACTALILAMGAGDMFLSMVLYLNAPQTFIFWVCLGYLTGAMAETYKETEYLEQKEKNA